jgi:hypothetical protein
MKELLEKAIQINDELGAKLKEMKDLEEPNLLGADGKYFTAKIKDIKCKGRARVEGGEVYLCQNELSGCNCQDKFGYKHSWNVRQGTKKDLIREYVTNLKLWDYLPKEGDYFYVKSKSNREYIAIAKNGEDLTSRFASLCQDYGQLYDYESGFVCLELDIKELRSATTEEIDLLDTKLKEDGKYFDKESMSIKEIEPLFKEGDYLTTTTKEGKRWVGIFDRYKVGDWVIITKPKDVRQKPNWYIEMNKYDGKTLMIERINSYGYLVIDGWKFNSDWCEKVEEPKSKAREMVKGLKEYFEKTSKDQVIKDWEATREFDVTHAETKIGELCIFWEDRKDEAIIAKLTKIDNYDDAPYVACSSFNYTNCILFESIEQYNEFRKG